MKMSVEEFKNVLKGFASMMNETVDCDDIDCDDCPLNNTFESEEYDGETLETTYCQMLCRMSNGLYNEEEK